MEHKIIHTENYLLIVDESEIKGKGFRLDLKRNSVGFIDDDIYYNERKDEFKKIISHLPLNNSPILEGLDLLPSLEDDIEKLAEEYANTKSSSEIFRDVHQKDFTEGYNKHTEKYKYTKEQMFRMFSYGMGLKGAIKSKFIEDKPVGEIFDELIIKLEKAKAKMPVGFKCNMVDFEVDMGLGEECIEYSQYPKTTTNSQGLTQWVGEYIY